ncbi:branched-chain amino acid ABC transporter permease [Agrobacterium tumefaciens]|uniref:Branched-chain amino acid ABC transporter permease n=1 Tax=Agrobacterium tumefaciens TaxID=358 RepID=A0A4D7YVW4_AGRTU|nr:branched-chain amino acid ABC transporter permease [Agrobacterium tumefaciens]QCL98146.1 branched-chain amino acid ABC transporter permease [Agrobacterium tumefaciens]
MDSTILLFLFQDGILGGAIYALLAVAFVLLFSVTRIIFIAQGDFVAYAGLTLSALERGETPGSVWMLLGLGFVAGIREFLRLHRPIYGRQVASIVCRYLLLPLSVLLLCELGVGALGGLARFMLTLAIVVPMGPFIYAIFFKSMAESSILNLLIVSVGVHWMMTGFGLLFFGAEGYRTAPMLDGSYEMGPLMISGQSILVLLLTVVILLMLYVFFSRSLEGKALRAAAVSSRGAGLVGISPTDAGMKAFLMAASIGTLSGILISPITTIYYDSGFLIGLKGFVAAIIGGFASYPIAVFGALVIGVAEAFSSFWVSAYKEIIVFGLIIPVLVWRSIFNPHPEEE